MIGKRKRGDDAEGSHPERSFSSSNQQQPVVVPECIALLRSDDVTQIQNGLRKFEILVAQINRDRTAQNPAWISLRDYLSDQLRETEGKEVCREIFAAWDRGHRSNHPPLSVHSLQLLTNIVSLLPRSTPSPFAPSPANAESPLTQVPLTILRILAGDFRQHLNRSLGKGRNDLNVVGLKFLNALLVALDGGRGGEGEGRRRKEIWELVDWDPKNVSRMLNTRRKTPSRGNEIFTNPGIRTIFLSFILTLLNPPPLPTSHATNTSLQQLQQSILSTPSIVAAIFRPLAQDDPVIIDNVLEGFAGVVEGLRSDLRYAVLGNKEVWEGVVKLYSLEDVPIRTRTIPTERNRDEDDTEMTTENDTETDQQVRSPSQSAHRFLLHLITLIAPPPPAPRTPASQKNPNQTNPSTSTQRRLLLPLLSSLKITEDTRQSELARLVLGRVPGLIGGFWKGGGGPSLEPRLSSKWISAIGFAERIVGMEVDEGLVSGGTGRGGAGAGASAGLPSISFLMDLVFPSSLNPGPKVWFTKGVQNENELVRYLVVRFLGAVLRKVGGILEVVEGKARVEEEDVGGVGVAVDVGVDVEVGGGLEGTEIGGEGRWTGLGRRLREEVKEVLPDPQIVVGLLQTSPTSKTATAATVQPAPETSPKKKTGGDVSPEDDLLSLSCLQTLQLYHQFLPSTFTNLKFDFSKLVLQRLYTSISTSVVAPPSPIEALCQASILRLISSSASSPISTLNLSWSKPFPVDASGTKKTPLSVLLELHRSSPIRSIRDLAGGSVRGLLGGSVLFEHDREGEEIRVWLDALGFGGAEGVDVLDVFDSCLTRCLQAPIRYVEQLRELYAASSTTGPLVRVSPLLATVVEQFRYHFKNEGPAEKERKSFLNLIRRLVFGFAEYLPSLDVSAGLLKVVEECVDEGRADGETREWVASLRDSMKVVDGGVVEEMTIGSDSSSKKTAFERIRNDVRDIRSEVGQDVALASRRLQRYVDKLSPLDENLFEALSGDEETRTWAAGVLPCRSVFIFSNLTHLGSTFVRPVFLSIDPSKALGLSQLMLHALNGLIRRLVEGALTRDLITKLLSELDVVLGTVRDSDRDRSKLLARVFGRDGLLGLFESTTTLEDRIYITKAIVKLVASHLNPSSDMERAMARPYCQEALRRVLVDSAGRATGQDVTEITLALVPFYEVEETLKLTTDLLTRMDASSNIVTSPTNLTTDLLASCLKKLLERAKTSDLCDLCAAHHRVLRSLHRHSGFEFVGDVMLAAARQILPFPEAGAPTGGAIASFLDFAKAASRRSSFWIKDVAASILLEGAWTEAEASLLALAVYRFASVKNQFVEALRHEAYLDRVLPFPRPMYALVDVFMQTGVNRSNDAGNQAGDVITKALPKLLDLAFKGDITAPANTIVNDTLSLLPRILPDDAREVFAPKAQAHVKALQPSNVRPSSLRLISDWLSTTPSSPSPSPLSTLLHDYVHKVLEWLVRRFAEDPELNEDTLTLTLALASVLDTFHGVWSLHEHLVDPVVTAALQNHMRSPDVMHMIATLIRKRSLKDVQVIRHIHSWLASPVLASLSRPPDGSKMRFAVFSVLEALFNAAPAAASRQADLLKRLVPLYLAMSEPSDNVLLRIFRRCEVAGGPSLRQFVTFWNNSGLRASLSAQPVETLGTLDPAIVYRTCVFACSTPIDAARIASTESIYDPIFILAVLAGAFDSDYRISGGEWLALLQCNILGLALSSLSSPRRELRLMADRVLAKARVQLTESTFRERDEIEFLLACASYVVTDKPSSRTSQDYPPAIVTLFLSHCARLIASPEDEMYPTFYRFLLQRPVVDVGDVPMFYSILYGTSETPRRDRIWLLRFLTDAVHSSRDWRILRRRQVWELFASLYRSGIADLEERRHILELLHQLAGIRHAATDLLFQSGVAAWIAQASLRAQLGGDEQEKALLLTALHRLMGSAMFGKVGKRRDNLQLSLAEVTDALISLQTNRDPVHLVDLQCAIVRRIVLRATTTEKTPVQVDSGHRPSPSSALPSYPDPSLFAVVSPVLQSRLIGALTRILNNLRTFELERSPVAALHASHGTSLNRSLDQKYVTAIANFHDAIARLALAAPTDESLLQELLSAAMDRATFIGADGVKKMLVSSWHRSTD